MDQTPEQLGAAIDFALSSVDAHRQESNAEHCARIRKLRRLRTALSAPGSTVGALLTQADAWLINDPLRGL